MTNTTETRRPFLNRNVGFVAGLNGGKQAYALLMGAYLTTDADFRTGADGKKDLLRCNIAINVNPWSLLGKEVEEAHADDPHINADAPFMTLAAFGETAKRYAGLKKGTKILFSGPLSVNTFKRKDGTEGAAVQVIANELMVASSRACDGDDPKGTMHCMTSMYKDQAGNEGEQRLCVLTGTVKSSKELNVTPAGQCVRNFTIDIGMSATKAEALCNGTFNKDTKYPEGSYVNLARWGEAAKHLDKVLVPGNVVAVLAALVVRETEDGNRFVNGTARDIAVLKWAKTDEVAAPAPEAAPASAPNSYPAAPEDSAEYAGSETGYAFADFDEEDELPF